MFCKTTNIKCCPNPRGENCIELNINLTNTNLYLYGGS